MRAKKKAERAEKLKEEERLAEKKANEKLVENYRQKKAEKIAQEKRKKKDIELEEQRIKPGIYFKCRSIVIWAMSSVIKYTGVWVLHQYITGKG